MQNTMHIPSPSPTAYVDLTNLYIEGQRHAALRGGFDSPDRSWRLNFRHLAELLGAGEGGRIRVFGSFTRGVSKLSQVISAHGMEPHLVDREPGRREKMVDSNLQLAAYEDAVEGRIAFSHPVLLVSGDADHCPIVSKLQSLGHQVHVQFWSRSTAHHLSSLADEFRPLDDLVEILTWRPDYGYLC